MSRNLSPGPGTGVTGRKMRETALCPVQCLPAPHICSAQAAPAWPVSRYLTVLVLWHQHFHLRHTFFPPLLLPLKIFWWPCIDLWYYVVHLSRGLCFVQWLITLGQWPGSQRVMVHCDQTGPGKGEEGWHLGHSRVTRLLPHLISAVNSLRLPAFGSFVCSILVSALLDADYCYYISIVFH